VKVNVSAAPVWFRTEVNLGIDDVLMDQALTVFADNPSEVVRGAQTVTHPSEDIDKVGKVSVREERSRLLYCTEARIHSVAGRYFEECLRFHGAFEMDVQFRSWTAA
jgi:hypothetical protein